MEADVGDLVAAIASDGLERGDPVAVAASPEGGLALAGPGGSVHIVPSSTSDPIDALRSFDQETNPRWVVWSRHDSTALLRQGLRLSSCWDIAAVHRLTVGGWQADPGRVWAHHRGLDPSGIPDTARAGAADDLFTSAERSEGDQDDPVRADGHLRPDWGAPGWHPTATQLRRWAAMALTIADAQMVERAHLADRPRAPLIARSESTAELLCNELSASGLPLDRRTVESILGTLVGPCPSNDAEAAEQRLRRDVVVLRDVPGSDGIDLRSPGQVKTLLRRAGIEVEDTRAWRLERLLGAHPVIESLLAWRKAERMATAFGYAWLDEHLDQDGRLRGVWTGCDGAAGRMTASAGLHNMPAELRPAVLAEEGHTFVRSDLGQIEPRVLAAVSGDAALAQATTAPDLYAGVADTLGVEREIAKVAVLGAMYGQTTGRGAQALVELRRAYPIAMDHLDRADRDARSGQDLRTYGGRRIRMDSREEFGLSDDAARSRVAARGRYGRNSVIQGAAAELFKMWAVTVRARVRPLGAEVVLCLHDELLVHAPVDTASEVAATVDDSLQEAVARWEPDRAVRFVTDTSLVTRWSDAKG